VAGELLARKAWSRQELLARLIRRGAAPELAAATVADLEARGHVDDAAFARLWIESRSSRYGARRLRAELRLRGVDSASIEAALAAAGPSELEAARRLAGQRLRALRSVGPERAAVRLRDHLRRRGYTSAVVAEVVREALGVGSGE
jgi:regulatory protein